MFPEGWNNTHLGELVNYKKGFAFDSSDYSDKGVRVIRISDTTRDGLHSNNPKYVPESRAASLGEWRLDAGDIIVSTVGSRPHLLDSMVGKAVRVPSHFDGSLLNQNLVKLAPRKDRVISEVLYPHLKDNRFITFISGLVRGNANQVSITLKELFQFPVLLPPLPEQRKIADILSTWDAAIEKTEALLATAKAQKRALMQSLLTGTRRFPEFEGQPWKEVRLGDVAAVDASSLGSKTPDDHEFEYISLSNVQPGRVVGPLEKMAYRDAPSRARRRVKAGDFLVSTVRPNLSGFARISEQHTDCIASTGFAVVSPRRDTDGSYLFHYLFSHHMAGQFYALVVGSNYPAINSSDVKKLLIKLPSVEEQRRIGAILNDCDLEISELADGIEKVRTEKKALMQQLLTGKRRVVV